MQRINSPCYQCTERHELCHMECQKYLEYNKRMDVIRAERRAQHDADTARWQVMNKRIRIKLNRQKRGD